MAYDDDEYSKQAIAELKGGGETGDGMPQEAPSEAPADGGGEGYGKEQFPTFHIPGESLPSDMGKKLAVGDILEFKVVAKPDQEGAIAVTYNTGEEKPEPESWENEFREAMSPRNPQSEPM